MCGNMTFMTFVKWKQNRTVAHMIIQTYIQIYACRHIHTYISCQTDYGQSINMQVYRLFICSQSFCNINTGNIGTFLSKVLMISLSETMVCLERHIMTQLLRKLLLPTAKWMLTSTGNMTHKHLFRVIQLLTYGKNQMWYWTCQITNTHYIERYISFGQSGSDMCVDPHLRWKWP